MSQTALVILLGWVLVVGVVLLVRRLWRKPGSSARSMRGVPLYARPQGKVRRGTQKSLMTLLNGDQKTASRLLQDARFRYPGKSEHWYWEKVIYDLKRDRRA